MASSSALSDGVTAAVAPGKTATLPFSATQNGLLEALLSVARYHGLAANGDELMRGLGAAPEGLTLTKIEEAADRLGLVIRMEHRNPAKVESLVLPVLIVEKNAKARVLLKHDAASKRIEWVTPAVSNEIAAMAAAALKDLDDPLIIYVAPKTTPSAQSIAQSPVSKSGQRDWFWSAVRRMWPNYAQVVVAAFIGNALALASPLFVMNVYDRVIPNLATATLWVLTTGVALAFFFDFLIRLLRLRLVDETGRRVDMAVSGRLFDHLLATQLAERPGSTGIAVNRMRDLDTVRDALTSSSVIAATDCLFIVLFLGVMWLLVGPLVLVPALAVPMLIGVTLLFQRPLAAALAKAQEDIAVRQALLSETISAFETVKVVGAESWLRRTFDRSVAAASRSATHARAFANLSSSISGFIFQAVSILIIVWGVFLVINGVISIGALIAANILASRVLAPLNNIAQTLARLQQASLALAALDKLMQTETERQVGGRAIDPGQSVTIRANAATFSYPNTEQPALRDINFTIEPGERIGIIGKVGSGKSTILRLLAGLYEPSSGSVLLNGLDMRQFAKAALRSKVGLCLQEAELFSGTLRNNLVMGMPFADPAALERAVTLSGVDAFAAEHPLGLDMAIAERGRSLSGGQRHAVSLARCLLTEPKLICLDEPTAHMDAASERALCGHLKALTQSGVGLVIATHRESLFALVDRLLVLDKGRLVLDGPKHDVFQALQARASAGEHGAAPSRGQTEENKTAS